MNNINRVMHPPGRNSIHNVYIEAYEEAADQFSVDLEGLIIIFIYSICATEHLVLNIKFVEEKPKNFTFHIYNNEVKFTRIVNEEMFLKCLRWPIMYVDRIIIGGLCSVARQLVKSSSDVRARRLLGFREACLLACSENSVWTKFCEVDMIEAIKGVLSNPESYIRGSSLELPVNVCRFEYHMAQPIRIHNVYKWARHVAKNKKVDSNTPIDKLDIDHKYSEGPFLTLADIILYLPFHIFFNYYHNLILEEKLPLTFAWYSRMKENVPKFNFMYSQFNNDSIEGFVEPIFEKQSLYKADPKRYKPERRIFTRQNLIDQALDVVKNSEIVIHNESKPYGVSTTFDWKNIPAIAGPIGGALPEKRLERKHQQLENMANAVLNVVKDEKRVIVDFCSGSGHLGILLAYLLPECTVILIENKEQSLLRASERVEAMEMKNIFLYQGNLDYFSHEFHLGVSLHACGSATDLVISKCIQRGADFVCCPCCYGSTKNCHDLSYPKSEQFRQLELEYKAYLSIAHAADQTHKKDDAKTDQGFFCMDIIDTDRKLHAESLGYRVYLGKLDPPSCTNKNNLLVGIHREAEVKSTESVGIQMNQVKQSSSCEK